MTCVRNKARFLQHCGFEPFVSVSVLLFEGLGAVAESLYASSVAVVIAVCCVQHNLASFMKTAITRGFARSFLGLGTPAASVCIARCIHVALCCLIPAGVPQAWLSMYVVSQLVTSPSHASFPHLTGRLCMRASGARFRRGFWSFEPLCHFCRLETVAESCVFLAIMGNGRVFSWGHFGPDGDSS